MVRIGDLRFIKGEPETVPGDHEQAVARMFRPDPRGKWNRERVRHVWVLAGKPNGVPTLDLVKMARLVSKFVSNARFTYSGRIEWRRVSSEFDSLEMLKMNLKLIFGARSEEIDPYLGCWSTYNDWETDLNLTAKRRIGERLERETDIDLLDERGNIRDINLFIKTAMYEVEEAPDMPGSRKAWVPYVSGTIPPDPTNWGFSNMGQQDVPIGTVVWTEFGPGIIESKGKKTSKVRIYDGRKIGMPNGVISLVAPERYKEFAAVVKDPQLWKSMSLDIFGIRNTKPLAVNEDVEEDVETLTDDDLNELEEEEGEEPVEADIIASIINGWPALLVMDDIPELGRIKGWNRVDPFISLSFHNWERAERFLEMLDDKAYVSPSVMTALREEMRSLKAGKSMTLNQQIDLKAFRNFFADQRKVLGKSKAGKHIVQPYWIAVESDIKLAFDIDSHNSSVISWLLKLQGKPSVREIKRNNAIWLNTFTSVREAGEDLAAVAEVLSFDRREVINSLKEIKDEIAALKRPRTRPRL